jgi:hypothetical protein
MAVAQTVKDTPPDSGAATIAALENDAAVPFRFPPLVESRASLSPIEKSLLGHLILLARPKVILEIGVYRAVTTRFIIEFLELNEIDCRVVGFDLSEIVDQLRAQPEVVRWEAARRLELVPGELPASLGDWLGANRPEVGLALIDARHQYSSVMWELRLIWPWLSPHGYIVGHDYCAEFDGVRYAFDHFAKKQSAMLMPLMAPAGAPAGRSVLVVLRRPAYSKTAGAWLRHHWEGWKSDLVRSRVVGSLWRNVLRPLFRSGG